MPAKGVLRTDRSAARGFILRQGLGRMKHISLNQLWIQERVATREVLIEKIRREVNVSDFHTHHWSTKEGVQHLAEMSIEIKGSNADTKDELIGSLNPGVYTVGNYLLGLHRRRVSSCGDADVMGTVPGICPRDFPADRSQVARWEGMLYYRFMALQSKILPAGWSDYTSLKHYGGVRDGGGIRQLRAQQ